MYIIKSIGKELFKKSKKYWNSKNVNTIRVVNKKITQLGGYAVLAWCNSHGFPRLVNYAGCKLF